MSDTPKDTAPPKDAAPPKPLSQELDNISAIQGSEAVDKPKPLERLPDQNFTDAQGRHLSFRDYPNGDTHYLRAFDQDKLDRTDRSEPTPSDSIAHANVQFERDNNGRVDRARLQDIFTAPTYREAGTGDHLLGQSELLANKNGARELYGSPQDEAAREWFVHRGYQVRNNGAEIYKTLRY